MSIRCVLQIVDRISRFAAEMPSMLSCRIRMAGPMSRKTWSAPWWLRSVPGSVSEFGERFGSLVSLCLNGRWESLHNSFPKRHKL